MVFRCVTLPKNCLCKSTYRETAKMYSEHSKHTTEIDLIKRPPTIAPFRQTLNRHALKLERGQATTLQINLGLGLR